MPQYAILAHPGHNRVYFDAAIGLSLAELEIAAGRLRAGFSTAKMEELSGIPYLLLETERPLSDTDVAVLSRLSFCYAIFAVEGELLRPVKRSEPGFFDSGISTILKYTGKTNELFTRMMINLALDSSDFAGEDRISLFDPVAGKGTTLFEGLRLGFDVTGMEIGGKAVQECCAYFKKYLETEKYKHETTKERKSGPNKAYTAHLYRYSFARTKEAFKAGDRARSLTMVEGNSRYADQLLKKDSFHLLVGDLPYGVAHGNVTNEKQSSLTRNPSELLTACLPAWRAVLRPGGTLALAWNIHVLPKEKLGLILEENGFRVLTGGGYDRLRHRVDRSILRDVVVAVKEK